MPDQVALRAIQPSDIQAVAGLHAASWQSAYRGILGDEFLDRDLIANREALWGRRLVDGCHASGGYIATIDGIPVGFAYAFFRVDSTWGTLVDNLHVHPVFKRRGMGRVLLRALSRKCEQVASDAGIFLWVYERNADAQRFYDRIGGARHERNIVDVPGGGTAAEWRYAWSSPRALDLELEAADFSS